MRKPIDTRDLVTRVLEKHENQRKRKAEAKAKRDAAKKAKIPKVKQPRKPQIHVPETPEEKRLRAARDQARYRARIKLDHGKQQERALAAVKRRAKELSLPCTLQLKHLTVPPVCPVLGIPLKNWGENTKPDMDSPSIDRIDPTKGYTPDNVRVISWRANKIKADASIEEVQAILSYMKGENRRTTLTQPSPARKAINKGVSVPW